MKTGNKSKFAWFGGILALTVTLVAFSLNFISKSLCGGTGISGAAQCASTPVLSLPLIAIIAVIVGLALKSIVLGSGYKTLAVFSALNIVTAVFILNGFLILPLAVIIVASLAAGAVISLTLLGIYNLANNRAVLEVTLGLVLTTFLFFGGFWLGNGAAAFQINRFNFNALNKLNYGLYTSDSDRFKLTNYNFSGLWKPSYVIFEYTDTKVPKNVITVTNYAKPSFYTPPGNCGFDTPTGYTSQYPCKFLSETTNGRKIYAWSVEYDEDYRKRNGLENIDLHKIQPSTFYVEIDGSVLSIRGFKEGSIVPEDVSAFVNSFKLTSPDDIQKLPKKYQ